MGFKSLPLYDRSKDKAGPFVPPNPACVRCVYNEGAPSVCNPAIGEPGGVMVIHDTPFAGDSASGLPFSSRMGQWYRDLIARYWDGPVSFDAAVRCEPAIEQLSPPPRAKSDKEERDKRGTKAVKMCAQYIHEQIRIMRPERIICIGPMAAEIVLGRSFDYYSVRGHVAWYQGGSGAGGWTQVDIPTFVLPRTPDLGNSIIRGWAEEDAEYALTTPLEELARPPEGGHCRIVTNAEEAEYAVSELMKVDRVYVDTETSGVLFTEGFRCLCCAVAPAGADYAYVWTGEAMRDPLALAALRRLLEAPTPRKAGQNIKYDRKVLKSLGISMVSIDSDCRLRRKMLDADSDADLDTMAEIVGCGGHKAKAHGYVAKAAKVITDARKAVEKGKLKVEDIKDPILRSSVLNPDLKPKVFAFAYIPVDILHMYCALDAIVSGRLDELFTAQMGTPELLFMGKHYDRLVRDASNAIAQVEEWGALCSQERLEIARVRCETELTRLRAVLDKSAPGLNLNSPPQLSKFLFDDLKLPSTKETDSGGRSTDSEALDAISHLHPIVPVIQEFRDIDKIYGTYVLGLQQRLGADGRVHPTFLIDGARSGRMSCTDPNLQNIPRKTSEMGRMVKDLFVAPPGYSLIQFDYSQLELRVAALMSEDPLMAEIYTSKDPITGKSLDYHKRTSELIAPVAWNLDPSQVQPEHRDAAKTVNFGLLYGMTDNGLAKRLKCERAQAGNIRNAIFGKFTRLAAWIEECVETAKADGYCYTEWRGERSRRRPLIHLADAPEKGGRPTYAYITARNSSFNTPVQGSASDFMLASIVSIVKWLISIGIPAKLVLTVHDSVILEVRDDFAELVIKTVRETMESQGWGPIPIVVDVERGPSWGTLSKVK